MATRAIILGLFSFVILRGSHGESVPYSVKNITNTGILFEDIGGLLAYHSTWHVVMDLNLGEIQEQIELAERAEHLVKVLCAGRHLGCTEQLSHVHSLVENLKNRSRALSESLVSRRMKRSLFDGVGRALHTLFGTMDDEDARVLYSRLNTLEDQGKELVRLEKQGISVVNMSLQEIHKPLTDVMNRQTELGLQIKNISIITDKLVAAERRNIVLTSLLAQFMEIETRQRTIIDIVVAIHNNKIHPLLISSKKLHEVYTKPGNLCPEFCEQILAQTAELQHFSLGSKLVVIIKLPLFQLPLMKLYQIHLFPIRTNKTYMLSPLVEFSYIAGDIPTQQFLLLPDNLNHKKIKHPEPHDLYVAPLTTPVIRSPPSTNEVIPLLYNPLGLTNKLPLRLSTTVTNALIKLSKPNSWLFFLLEETPIHIRCDGHITTHQLVGHGILTLHLPCTIQISEMLIHYEAESTHQFEVIQPKYFPDINPKILELDLASFTPDKHPNAQKLKVITAENRGYHLPSHTHELNELYSHLDKIKFDVSTKRHVHLSTASVGLAGCSLIAVCVFLIVRAWKGRCRRKVKAGSPSTLVLAGTPLRARANETINMVTLPKPTPNPESHTKLPSNSPRSKLPAPSPNPSTLESSSRNSLNCPTRSFQLV